MNELVQSFFANGYNKEIQECVVLFLETIKSIVFECEKEELLAVYLIDHINNTTYHNDQIKYKCTAIKQIHLLGSLSEQETHHHSPQQKEIEHKIVSAIYTEEFYVQPTHRP